MNKQPWALILGASSGFGEAAAIELSRAGMNIFGVHLDPPDKRPHAEEVCQKIRALGREAEFFNVNAADDEFRRDTIETIRQRLSAGPLEGRPDASGVPASAEVAAARSGDKSGESKGTLRVLLHSLALGWFKPLAGAEQVVAKKQLEITVDTMGHSLVYWVQDCLRAGLFEWGARIFAMTSAGAERAIPNYGPASAAKAAMEAHVRQLALELAPAGITANAIRAGFADTPSLRLIPGHEQILAAARRRNPHRRLTTPEDVARSIAALCHPATYWMTGNTLHVDGGESIVE